MAHRTICVVLRDVIEVVAVRPLPGIVLLACLGFGAASGQPTMHHGRGMHGAGMRTSMLRHRFVHRHGIDAQYAGKTSPLAPTAADIDSGKRLYAANCAQCHGPAGLGDGEAGKSLSPPPAIVARAGKLPIATDAYLYWTIAEGGAPVGSAMPPFKTVLGETEIWQVVAYLRRL